MEKDIHASHKGQGAATNREKGQGVTRTRAGDVPCKNGLARTLICLYTITGRAWLSMALNEGLMESYLRCFEGNLKLVKKYSLLVLDLCGANGKKWQQYIKVVTEKTIEIMPASFQ
jgi:hypothetical protein